MKEALELEVDIKVPEKLKKPKGWGTRHTLALLGFFGFSMSYAMRFNLSIAIVAMVKQSGHSSDSEARKATQTCVYESNNQSYADHHIENGHEQAEGEFSWDAEEQGLILGSFFWGYVVTQLPGGVLSDKYGGKWPLGGGLLLTAIFAILTPVAARTHKSLLILCRVVQGLGEGLTTPAMHEMLGYWAPPNERSQLAGIIYAGCQFGTAAIMIVSGYLIHGGILGGWPSVFYLTGLITLIWFILWTMFIYNRPSDHPNISKEELHYLETSIGTQAAGEEKTPTPWKAIFTSLPVWAIVVGHCGHAWGLYTILTELPTYLSTVLQFDIKQNSWLSAIPYLLMWITSFIIPKIADSLIAHGYVRTVTIRKSCQAIAHLGSAIALVAASYTGCDRVATVTLITAAVAINGAIYSGYIMNHVDIANRHSGILMGITNTLANFTGFAAPYVCGLLINKDPSLQNWQYVFFIAAAIYVFNVVFYTLFASSTEQPWNKGVEKKITG